ncbi:hypothetical protein M569_06134 [Genlisea aurea]|uniref:LisH domain-containing protein n=1 Tax=Genlisea aurea TaxID=192259 RepID=S8DZ67_9LAMI|nr:hypothetical protein M569_06134 [Genlisea aurea]
MSQTNWEADKMLDVYIHDYLVKRDLKATAQAFQAEGKVSSDPVAIDAPGGFLFEWWSVFWDIFIARTNEKHSEVAASYIESQLMKTREQHQPQQQLQMQQLLLQRQAQQQQQKRQQRQDVGGNGIVGNDSITRQGPGTANAMATKMYEEKLKIPVPRDVLDDPALKQRFSENVGQLLDPNILKSAGQPSGQVLHGNNTSAMSPQIQARSQQFPGSTPEIKPETNQMVNQRGVGPEGSLIGIIPGPNAGGNNLTLKGWPLTGLDQLRNTGLVQQQKPFLQGPQPFSQLQMFSPQNQQLMLAQQALASPSVGDLENRRLKMLLNNRNLSSNSVVEMVSNMGSPLQPGYPVMTRADPEMVMKLKIAQLQQQQQLLQQNNIQTQHLQQSQNSNHTLQQDRVMGGSLQQNSFRGNDQALKNQTGRKRKQPVSSSGPANSSGTGNTAGVSPSSAPSTPSNHTAGGDVMSLPHSGGSSKPLMMFGGDNANSLASSSSQPWDDKDLVQADIDRFVDDADDNVESFLAHDVDPRDAVARCMEMGKGFTFIEVNCIRATAGKVSCCQFSSDGKLLATAGRDKNVVIWYTDTLKLKTTLEEHSSAVTDIRFSPSMARLATSSFDQTVRVWDADNPGYSLRTFTGHSAAVLSLDFHPNKEDQICSCGGDGEIRYWSINNGNCTRVFKGNASVVRFQPRLGRYLAAAFENVVSVFDVETQACRHSLKCHTKPIQSICWDSSGEFLASLSEDSVKVWSFRNGSEGGGECVHEISCSDGRFRCCVFHPGYSPLLLVVGGFKSLEVWNVAERRTLAVAAHDGPVSCLAASNVAGLVASGSHDKVIKLWK